MRNYEGPDEVYGLNLVIKFIALYEGPWTHSSNADDVGKIKCRKIGHVEQRQDSFQRQWGTA